MALIQEKGLAFCDKANIGIFVCPGKKKKKALFSQVLFFDIVVAKPDRSQRFFLHK